MVSRSYSKRISNVMKSAKEIMIDNNSRIVIMSDCHRGTGKWNDGFANNEKITFTALCYYYSNGYRYIELGDGDELWENRDYEEIINEYSNIFWIISRFQSEKRFNLIYGNHDIVKRRDKYMKKYFPDTEVNEGIMLKNIDNDDNIFLLHGHQGELLNDTLWPLARWLVRYIWTPLELLGFHNPFTPRIDNYDKKDLPVKLKQWADENKQKVIAGHTHKPLYPENEGHYYNCGSLTHPRCITAIEINMGKIQLVKWCIDSDSKGYLYIKREIL